MAGGSGKALGSRKRSKRSEVGKIALVHFCVPRCRHVVVVIIVFWLTALVRLFLFCLPSFVDAFACFFCCCIIHFFVAVVVVVVFVGGRWVFRAPHTVPCRRRRRVTSFPPDCGVMRCFCRRKKRACALGEWGSSRPENTIIIPGFLTSTSGVVHVRFVCLPGC